MPKVTSAQTDREFWFVAPNVYDGGRSFNKPIVLQVTASASPATVTISQPANPSFTPIVRNIAANSTDRVDVTVFIDQLQNAPANTTLNKGLLITSSADITAYYEVVSGFCNCNPELFSLKGKNALGTEFFISSQYTYDESTAYSAATNSFDIVATKNNTHITITPSKDIVGHNANVAFNITLDAGQTYSAVATSGSAGGHLQGSYITSDNPIAITLKDDLVQVSSCADLIGDQAVPTNVLGTEYIVTKGFLQPNDNIYIMAIENGTSVYQDGNSAPTAVLAKGQSYTINLINNSTYIRSDKKIYVYHLTGNGCEVGSAIIPKLNCTGSKSVSVVRSNNDLFAVLITTKNGNQNSFTVNGDNTLVKSTDFSPVPGTGGAYVTSRIDLSNAAAVGSALNFANPSGNFSLGFINGGTNTGTLYGFFSDFKSSNVQNASVETCPSSPVQLTAYGGVGYRWIPTTGLSDPNIANPMASPASTTDYQVEITTADGCVDFANVHVAVSNGITPSISIAASQNNICTGTMVTFTATSVNAGSTPFYQWQVNAVNAGANSAIFNSNTLGNNDKVTCILTSSAACASPANVTSAPVNMIVNTNAPPSVSIMASQNNICAGTLITLNAIPVNGGPSPGYQWQVNGVNAGQNDANFSSSGFADGDKITCIITSSTTCAVPVSFTSNSVTISVNPILTTSVNIVASQNNVCAGTPVSFTATGVNGGTTAVYQWQVNGINAGTNSPNFGSSSLANADKVTCVMTSTTLCAAPTSATSAAITMVVNPYTTPALTITASATSICPGTAVIFTASSLNAGNAPAYQWLLNGGKAGLNAASFSTNSLANGDVISCLLTSDNPCITTPTSTSNSIVITVNTPVVPLITINVSDNNICAGTNISFNASITNGGSNPNYQWQINGRNTGENRSVFQSSNLATTDLVTCTLTSSALCAAPVTVTSTGITMIVNPLPVVNGGGDKIIDKDKSIQLTATATGDIADVSWSPSIGLDNPKALNPTASPEKSSLYTLTVTSTAGCISSAKVKVTVLVKLVIPSVFTPNGDGVNDKWEVGNLIDYPGAFVKIFNRWGQEVFRSADSGSSWDGTRKGKPLPFGTYYYIIDLGENSTPVSGFVAIMR